MRKSVKNQRDNQAIGQAQKEIEALKKHQSGVLDLVYFDEAGFSLDPCVPYAWQPLGETLEIPASKGKRLNVLGSLNIDNDFTPFA